jgi:hypothetical protein
MWPTARWNRSASDDNCDKREVQTLLTCNHQTPESQAHSKLYSSERNFLLHDQGQHASCSKLTRKKLAVEQNSLIIGFYYTSMPLTQLPTLIPFCRQRNTERQNIIKCTTGRAIAQAVIRRLFTAVARIRAQGESMWDLWWTKRHSDSSSPGPSVFSRQYHSTAAPYSPMFHLGDGQWVH